VGAQHRGRLFPGGAAPDHRDENLV